MTEEQKQTITHREARLADLREDIAKLQEKLAKKQEAVAALELEGENEDRIKALANGDTVAYVYGRAASKRVLSGTVRAVATNDKGVVQLKVESGEGFDAEFHLIDASSLLLTNEQVDAANAAIAAEAAARAAAEAANKENK